jgi:hypothetical protein
MKCGCSIKGGFVCQGSDHENMQENAWSRSGQEGDPSALVHGEDASHGNLLPHFQRSDGGTWVSFVHHAEWHASLFTESFLHAPTQSMEDGDLHARAAAIFRPGLAARFVTVG